MRGVILTMLDRNDEAIAQLERDEARFAHRVMRLFVAAIRYQLSGRVDESRAAVQEIFRVLKPGGRALVGVPNLLDPFLRPLLVAVLDRLGRYDYGMEKAFTHGQLARLLESAGFRVGGRSGILFMPGWLRMADLWLHVRGSRWARLTAAATRPSTARCPGLASCG